MKILTKEDIEKSGCIYEPDESKCSIRKIRVHFDCCYYKDGQWKYPIVTEIPNGEWKDSLIERLKELSQPWSCINDVFVPDIRPLSGEGVMCRWLMIRGHKVE